MKHLWDKRHINCKFQVSCTPGALGVGENCPKVTNFQKSSSLQPHMSERNQMLSDVEQECLYQNCKFGDPRGRSSDPRAGGGGGGGQTWYIVYICKTFEKHLFQCY